LSIPAAWQYVRHPGRTALLAAFAEDFVVVGDDFVVPVGLVVAGSVVEGGFTVADVGAVTVTVGGGPAFEEFSLPPHDAKVVAARSAAAAAVIDRHTSRLGRTVTDPPTSSGPSGTHRTIASAGGC